MLSYFAVLQLKYRQNAI